MNELTFWHGLGLGWLLGLATFPFVVVAVSWLMARWFDRRALRGKMSPAWIRDKAGRGRFVEQEDESLSPPCDSDSDIRGKRE